MCILFNILFCKSLIYFQIRTNMYLLSTISCSIMFIILKRERWQEEYKRLLFIWIRTGIWIELHLIHLAIIFKSWSWPQKMWFLKCHCIDIDHYEALSTLCPRPVAVVQWGWRQTEIHQHWHYYMPSFLPFQYHW